MSLVLENLDHETPTPHSIQVLLQTPIIDEKLIGWLIALNASETIDNLYSKNNYIVKSLFITT